MFPNPPSYKLLYVPSCQLPIRYSKLLRVGLERCSVIQSAHYSLRRPRFSSGTRQQLTTVCDISARRTDTFFWPPRAPCMHSVCANWQKYIRLKSNKQRYAEGCLRPMKVLFQFLVCIVKEKQMYYYLDKLKRPVSDKTFFLTALKGLFMFKKY